MKRFIITLMVIGIAIVGIIVLQYSPATSTWLWSVSHGGTWLLPLVLASALLDSVHPCSFSILLLTIAFLFSVQFSRRRILAVGGTYIAGIFVAYLLIGLGLLHALNLFNTPHFMGKLGAALLIAFGAINLINEFFPAFPIKLKLPSAAHTAMGRLMERASIVAAFGLGMLVGVCQFPCMGGPYLMAIGLLHDTATYVAGLGYLALYNVILVLPLAVVLWVAADNVLLEKVKIWKKANLHGLRFWAGIAMIVLGSFIFFL